MASKAKRKTNHVKMDVVLAHAAAMDTVDGPATRHRKAPWDDAAWDAYFKAFHRFIGTDDPAKVAELFADHVERLQCEAAKTCGDCVMTQDDYATKSVIPDQIQLMLELGEQR